MHTTLYTADFLQTIYRPDTCMIISRWLRSVTSDELKIGYEAILAAALHYNCRHWLVDVRRRCMPDQASTQWVLEYFCPQSAARLGGTVYFSFLLSPTYLSETEENPTLPPLAYSEAQPFRLQRFDDERQANDWLTLCQHRR